jgi:hypothetical protein
LLIPATLPSGRECPVIPGDITPPDGFVNATLLLSTDLIPARRTKIAVNTGGAFATNAALGNKTIRVIAVLLFLNLILVHL